MLAIVCDCEGMLEQPHGGPVIHCTRCRREYPFKELKTILMLLKKAFYTPASEQQAAPNENEQRVAIRKAAIKLMRMKLRVVDNEVPLPPPQVPAVRGGFGYTASVGSVYTTATSGNVYVRVTLG